MQDLTLKARRILETVYNNGGEATTTEIRDLTEIERSPEIKYHAQEILEDLGLVSSEKVTNSQHPSGVWKYEITEEGEDRIAHLYEGEEDIPIKDRMEDLEGRFGEVEDHFTEVLGKVKNIEVEAEDSRREAMQARESAEEVEEIFTELREETMSRIDELEETVESFREERDSRRSRIDELEDSLGDRVLSVEEHVEELEEHVQITEEPEETEADFDESKPETEISEVDSYLEELANEGLIHDENGGKIFDLSEHLSKKFNLSEYRLSEIMDSVETEYADGKSQYLHNVRVVEPVSQ